MNRQRGPATVSLRLLELLEGVQPRFVRFVVLLLPGPAASFLIALAVRTKACQRPPPRRASPSDTNQMLKQAATD